MKEQNPFARQQLLLGQAAMDRLARATVAVFGVGGVGSYVVEALARSGTGHLLLIDNDHVSTTNLNRQLIALHSTIGQLKVEAARARVLDINPRLGVDTFPLFVTPENLDQIPLDSCDYVVDAIDTVSAKLALALRYKHGDLVDVSPGRALSWLKQALAAGAENAEARFYAEENAQREREAELEKMAAEAEAEAITLVQTALAESLRMLNAAAPNDQVVKLKALEAMAKIADGKATKIIIPSELQGLAGLAASAKALLESDPPLKDTKE